MVLSGKARKLAFNKVGFAAVRTLVLCLALAAASAASSGGAAPVVLDGATLVDVTQFGRSAADVEDAVVVIGRDRIVAAGPRSQIAIPEGARKLDARGTFIVPGLHDLFATLNSQGQASAFLAMGVTSIVGLDEEGGRRGPLKLDADPSPRIRRLEVVTGYDTSMIPGPEWSVGTAIDRGRKLSAAELDAEVDSLAGSGVRALLLYYTLDPDQVRTIVRRARERGLFAIGELGATTYPQAIEAGVMAFVHTSRYSLELVPRDVRDAVARSPFGPPRRRFYEALMRIRPDSEVLSSYARTLAKGGTALMPTLAMNYLELPGHLNPWMEPAAALLDPSDIHLPADRGTGEQVREENAVRDGFPAGTAIQLAMIEKAYARAGAKYLAGSGTDAFGTMPGISLHIELEQLVAGGLTPRQALAAATGNVAELIPWPRTGRIAAGYDADLLVLEADPTADIGNLKRIRWVFAAGRQLEPKRLIAGH